MDISYDINIARICKGWYAKKIVCSIETPIIIAPYNFTSIYSAVYISHHDILFVNFDTVHIFHIGASSYCFFINNKDHSVLRDAMSRDTVRKEVPTHSYRHA